MKLAMRACVALVVMLPWVAHAEDETSSENAVQLGFEYRSDLLSNASGGVTLSGALTDTRAITMDFNMQPLLGWTNTRIHVNYLYTNGGNPAAVVGAYGVSNLEAGVQGVRLFEFWFEHDIGEYNNLLFGLYDLNSEFDVIPAAGLFINGAFGIGNDIAQTGANGPSIFPNTSLALRYRSANANGRYFQVALLDGDPGTGFPRISWNASEGFLLALEGGISDGREGAMEGKLSYGAWGYSVALSQDAAGVAISPSFNYGLYVMINGALMQEENDPDQGLTGFFRVGIANPLVNIYSAFTSVGLVYTGLIPGMDKDQLGIGLAMSLTSQHYFDTMAVITPAVDPFEVVLELSYRNQFGDNFYVQPFTQMIFNPGLDPTIGDARVYGMRMAFSF